MGDLRPYLAVQFGSLLLVVLVLALFPRPGRETGYLVAGAVSGHTLKHLVAAIGKACVVASLGAPAIRRS